MTHHNNYNYVKKWRQNNKEKYKVLNKKCCLKQSRWRQVIGGNWLGTCATL